MRWDARIRSTLLVAATLGLGAEVCGAEDLQWFRRGDSNGDGRLDVSDATHSLGFLFLGVRSGDRCWPAMDANDDDEIDLADAIYTLGFLFLGTKPPPAPFERCGPDPDPAVGPFRQCERYSGCPEQPGASLAGHYGPPVFLDFDLRSAFEFGRIDADHTPDLVTGGAWFAGRGDGTFGEPRALPINSPMDVLIEDLNRDGASDVVALTERGRFLSVLLGRGDGTFLPPTNVSDSASTPYVRVEADDVNSDEWPDLVVSSEAGISIFLGTGDDSVEAAGERALEVSDGIFGLGDFDSDGAVDVVATSSLWTIAWLPGDGDGSLAPPVPIPSRERDGTVGGLAAGDIDGDGHLDVAVTRYTRDIVEILLGNGNGSFRAAGTCAAGHFVLSPDLVDLDGDGALDLVTSSFGWRQVFARRGIGDGTFGPAARFDTTAASSRVFGVDVDGDGRLDLVNNLSGSQGPDMQIRLAREVDSSLR